MEIINTIRINDLKIFSSIHSPYNSYLYIKDLVINQYRPIANKIEDSTDLISMKWFWFGSLLINKKAGQRKASTRIWPNSTPILKPNKAIRKLDLMISISLRTLAKPNPWIVPNIAAKAGRYLVEVSSSSINVKTLITKRAIPMINNVLLKNDVKIELSLIHIWRCRRYAVCRSRWSPYH